MEADPYPSPVPGDFSVLSIEFWKQLAQLFQQIETHPFTMQVGLAVLSMALLLLISALISGSEVAFFSIKEEVANQEDVAESRKKYIQYLLGQPQLLLATILIMNNFVNVGIVILSTYITEALFDFSTAQFIGVFFQVVVVTFLLLLFGEIIPKVYASQYYWRFAGFMSRPLYALTKYLKPLSRLLIWLTQSVNKKSEHFSVHAFSEVYNYASQTLENQEREILDGIMRYRDTEVHEIMRPRVDVVALDKGQDFQEVLQIIKGHSYSRIPVYEETFDSVVGILYIKDLLAHLNAPKEFAWYELVKEATYVTENKKINDLLLDFQTDRVHMAIVVDEYGGTKGIVTMEDILEEIIGEISDESDIDEPENYSILKDGVYLFDGKTLLNDFSKLFNLEKDYFQSLESDPETISGLILEKMRRLPKRDAHLVFQDFHFYIDEVDERRIKKIRVETGKKLHTE